MCYRRAKPILEFFGDPTRHSSFLAPTHACDVAFPPPTTHPATSTTASISTGIPPGNDETPTDVRTCRPASPKALNEQIRTPINHIRMLLKRRHRTHKPPYLQHPPHAQQTPQLLPHHPQQPHPRPPRRRPTLLPRYLRPHLPRPRPRRPRPRQHQQRPHRAPKARTKFPGAHTSSARQLRLNRRKSFARRVHSAPFPRATRGAKP